LEDRSPSCFPPFCLGNDGPRDFEGAADFAIVSRLRPDMHALNGIGQLPQRRQRFVCGRRGIIREAGEESHFHNLAARVPPGFD
jgi:hypothetical protein